MQKCGDIQAVIKEITVNRFQLKVQKGGTKLLEYLSFVACLEMNYFAKSHSNQNFNYILTLSVSRRKA